MWTSCVAPPDFPIEPIIEYEGISKAQLSQGSLFEDSLFLFIGFTDGDGDFGANDDNDELNIMITDTRTGESYQSFKAPAITSQSASQGISGRIQMLIFNTCCIFPPEAFASACDSPPAFPTNELKLDIQIMDRAGNISNTITTDAITLLCN